MKFNYLKINGFGKLKNKDITLEDGINIIYGKNESGKSSLLKFMSSMIYGISKNKNGKEISDFDRFSPWQSEEFSGKIKYTLDDGALYEVYREFKKKNPIIYNEKQEDISKNFNIDKTKGIEFFYEQTGIDEDTFFNTAITEQEGVKLSRASQSNIIQKISNKVSTGDDNISFKKSIDKINKLQNENVGTERTSQRPINIINNNIRDLLDKKKTLEMYKESMYDNSLEKEQLYMEEEIEEVKKSFLKEIKSKLDNNRIKGAEINFNRNLELEYEDKIDELNKQLEVKFDSKNEEKKGFLKFYIIISIFIILGVVLTIINKNMLLSLVGIIPAILLLLYISYKKLQVNKNLKKKKRKYDIDKEKILNEIDLLKKNRDDQRNEANIKQRKLDSDIERENNELIDKYIRKLDLGFMEESIDKNYDEILREIEEKENKLSSIKLKINTMENDSKNILKKLDDLSRIEEELEKAEEEKDELVSLNKSYELAKDCLETAYKEVKENISPKFATNLCNTISKISNDKYKKIIFSDENGLKVEIENGNYVSCSRLSTGTIDQLYMSLRLSALDEISNETLPIILDEAFAYFDNERLSNILQYLKINFQSNQIIILTCSDREKTILNNLNIEYNLINLEK